MVLGDEACPLACVFLGFGGLKREKFFGAGWATKTKTTRALFFWGARGGPFSLSQHLKNKNKKNPSGLPPRVLFWFGQEEGMGVLSPF